MNKQVSFGLRPCIFFTPLCLYTAAAFTLSEVKCSGQQSSAAWPLGVSLHCTDPYRELIVCAQHALILVQATLNGLQSKQAASVIHHDVTVKFQQLQQVPVCSMHHRDSATKLVAKNSVRQCNPTNSACMHELLHQKTHFYARTFRDSCPNGHRG